MKQKPEGIILDQSHYTETLKTINFDKIQTCKTSNLSEAQKENLRQVIGKLLWVAGQTRPDISYNVCRLSANYKNATKEDLLLANKTIKKLKEYSSCLNFRKLQGPVKIVAFSDASHGNMPGGGSQGAFLIFFVDKNGLSNIVTWQSRKVRRVVRSTLSAETLALSDCMDAAIYTAVMYTEIMYGKSNTESIPIEIVTDSKSLLDSIKSNKPVSEKRLRIDIAAIKEALQKGQISEIKWAPTNIQLANGLTKQSASPIELLRVIADGTVPVHRA